MPEKSSINSLPYEVLTSSGQVMPSAPFRVYVHLLPCHSHALTLLLTCLLTLLLMLLLMRLMLLTLLTLLLMLLTLLTLLSLLTLFMLLLSLLTMTLLNDQILGSCQPH